TGKDPWPKAINRGGERVLVWRMSPYERRGSRNVDLCHRTWDTLRGNALKRQRTSYHLSTPICHIFTPSARPAHDESGSHHSTYDDAAWPSGYAAVGRPYCLRT